jgi:hypothetical protein
VPKWEYAQFNWEGAGRGAHRSVMFTHQQNMEKFRSTGRVISRLFASLVKMGGNGVGIRLSTGAPAEGKHTLVQTTVGLSPVYRRQAPR